MHCVACCKPIHGSFYQYDGQEWHAECFCCDYCKKPIGGHFNEMGGKYLHTECYDECYAVRCTKCHMIIKGAFFEHGNAVYCPDDYHAHVAPRCSLCNKVLEGEYQINAWEEKCCNSHSFLECPSCGRWHGDGSRARISFLCPTCLPQEVGLKEIHAYGPTFGEAVLAMFGAAFLPPAIPIHLVPAISSLAGLEPRDDGFVHHGLTHTTVTRSGDREVGRTVDGIEILRGLARHHFESVLAHEYGHAWLFLQGADTLTSWQAEGFCQLLSYLWLEHTGSQEARHLQDRINTMPDMVYGDGFRRIHSAWVTGGPSGVRLLLGVG